MKGRRPYDGTTMTGVSGEEINGIWPNFLVIGAMKCATTSICDILAEHPQAFVSRPKEPNFFSNDAKFRKGLKWYLSLFAGAAGKIAIGEGSTNYTKAPLFLRSPERIAKHLPHAKLIYVVRHPLERIESHWRHQIVEIRQDHALAEAMARWPEMLDISLYWRQLSRYREHYPDEQILVVFFEDFASHPEAVMGQVCDFLGIDRLTNSEDVAVRSNASSNLSCGRRMVADVQIASEDAHHPASTTELGGALAGAVPARGVCSPSLAAGPARASAYRGRAGRRPALGILRTAGEYVVSRATRKSRSELYHCRLTT